MPIRAAVFACLYSHHGHLRFCATYLEWIAMKYTKLYDVKRKHVMACAREYADISGASLKCVNRRYGVYDFTPGVKVGNAIVD